MRVLSLLAHAAALAAAAAMPLPFTRVLSLQSPCLSGSDVLLLQHLLQRSAAGPPPNITDCYDTATASAVHAFQTLRGLSATGTLDNVTAASVLSELGRDHFVDDDTPPAQLGFLYKLRVTLYANRSIETNATLIAGNGTPLFSFRVRGHGVDVAGTSPAWPYFNSCCDGANGFAGNGNTPTGLATFDLNSPEDEPEVYGPYPVNRMVQGLKGNALFVSTGSGAVAAAVRIIRDLLL